MTAAIGQINQLLARPLAGESLGDRLDKTIDLIREVYDDHAILRTILLNRTITTPGLVIGTSSKAKVKIGSTFTFLNGGVPYSKTSAEIAFTATTHDIAPNAGAAQERWYVLSIIGDGTVTITAGTAGAVGAGTYPATPAGGTPIGLVRIEIAAGSTPFDASSDDLDAAHITDDYWNLVGVGNPADVPAALAGSKPSAL